MHGEEGSCTCEENDEPDGALLGQLQLCVVGHRAGNVKFPAQLPQRNRHPAGAHRAAHPRHTRGSGVESVCSSAQKRWT
jgi:hypothetical protein